MQSNCLVAIVGLRGAKIMSTGEPSKKRAGISGWFSELDLLLRGELTRVSSLRTGGLEINPGRLSLIIILLAMIYGVCMGTFSVFRPKGSDLRLISPIKSVDEIPRGGKDLVIVADVDHVLHFRMLGGDGAAIVNTDEKKLPGQARQIEGLRTQLMGLWPPHELTESDKARVTSAVTSIVGHPQPRSADPTQVLASMLKVPLLFYLTLLVTFPSLYVFNALVGSRLSLGTVVRLLVASLGVMVTVLSSLGPIVAFFSVSTASYAFMLLFNVVVYAVAGTLGMAFLLQTLHRMSVIDSQRLPGSSPTPPSSPESLVFDDPSGALEPLENRVLSKHVKTVFRLWVIVFALVGAQMGWVLRPFVGNPNTPFTWFRPRASNFFQAVLQTLQSLLS
jgi:hypothetical protein